MARTDPQVNFRMPQELRDQIAEAAKANNRSITAEIISRLEDSFTRAVKPLDDASSSAAAVTEEALEAASERGAQKAMEKLFEPIAHLDHSLHDEMTRSYLDYAMSVIAGRKTDRVDSPESRSATPSIPGVNAPKRGLGAPPKPKKG